LKDVGLDESAITKVKFNALAKNSSALADIIEPSASPMSKVSGKATFLVLQI
jgi:hypothetical protein